MLPLLVLLCAVPAGAQASALGTLHLDWDNAYSCLKGEGRHHGFASGPAFAVDLGETIGIRGRYLRTWYSSAGPDFVVDQLGGGLVVRLDVFKYIPWMELGYAYRMADAATPVQPLTGGISVGFGVDALHSRSWSYGAFTYLQKLTNEIALPAVMTLGVRVGYRFSFGDPF